LATGQKSLDNSRSQDLAVFGSKFKGTTFVCSQKEIQIILPKPILTFLKYTLPYAFLINITLPHQ